MDHNEEVQIVKKALDLEIEVDSLSRKYNQIQNDPEPVISPAPQRQSVPRPSYPAVKSQVKFDWKKAFIPFLVVFWVSLFLGKLISSMALIFALLIIFAFFAEMVWLVLCIKQYFDARKKDKEDISNTPEYKNACAEIDRQYQEAVNRADAEYNKKMDEYNNTVVVEYNKKLESWRADHEAALAQVGAALDTAERKLSEHYENTKVIPVKYHDIGILEYIYSVINSSQYSLKECFDDYEREETRRLEEEKLRVATAQANLTAEQNSLLDQQNSIAEKARRDQNISNIVRGIQHHNTNKILDERLKK